MLRNARDSHPGTSASGRRLTVFAAAVVLLATCGGCRPRGQPGPARYQQEKARDEAALRREQERTGQEVSGRYPWEGRNDTSLGSLPRRISEMDAGFRRESEIHHQVIHGGRNDVR